MKVDEFLDEYKKFDEEAKGEYVKSIINTKYVSYATKISDCKRIIQSTSYTNTDPNMFCMNSPARHMLLNLQMIERYTDLEIDYNNALNIYDMLDEVDAITGILGCIPFKEASNYNHIMKMMLKDFRMNERSMIGYLDSKLASMKILGESLDKIMEEVSV